MGTAMSSAPHARWPSGGAGSVFHYVSGASEGDAEGWISIANLAAEPAQAKKSFAFIALGYRFSYIRVRSLK